MFVDKVIYQDRHIRNLAVKNSHQLYRVYIVSKIILHLNRGERYIGHKLSMNTVMSPARKRRSAKIVDCYVMLYLQYACDMMTAQMLCLVAINNSIY